MRSVLLFLCLWNLSIAVYSKNEANYSRLQVKVLFLFGFVEGTNHNPGIDQPQGNSDAECNSRSLEIFKGTESVIKDTKWEGIRKYDLKLDETISHLLLIRVLINYYNLTLHNESVCLYVKL